MMSNAQVKLEQARKFVREFSSFPEADYLREYYLESLGVLENSELEEDRQLARERRLGLPKEAGLKPKIVPLESLYIHRIWIEGDPTNNSEFQTGLFSQPKADAWTNLLWVYNSHLGPPKWETLHGRQLAFEGKKLSLNKELLQINFRRTMEAWDERPAWINRYLQYLDAMLPKKAYVAMGDIMRMIILWFMGGVYVDVKIKFVEGAQAFLKDPRVAQDRLMCVYDARVENWAMMSHMGCDMAREILEKALKRLPSLEKIAQMPVNWSHSSGKYSRAHAELHEDKSVWPVLQMQYGQKIVLFHEVEPALKLENPRAENSWANNDGVAFDW